MAAFPKNDAMVKKSEVFGWDTEPVDERPSEFMPSTGYAMLSGYHGLEEAHRVRRSRTRVGVKSLLVFVVAIVGLAIFAMLKLVAMRHG